MKEKQLPRRILQYIAGLTCMAVGLVLLKRTVWGVSPITAVPDAVANITPLTLGNATTLLHLLCVVGQIIIQRKVTLKSLLCAFVGIPFGWLVDLFMLVWDPTLNIVTKILSLAAGIAVQGFGVALIHGCDMMLPAPDEMNSVISKRFDKPLSKVKVIADASYVCIALIINLFTWLFCPEKLTLSVGISSVAAVLLTGRFVGLSFKLLPKIRMSPFFNALKNSDTAADAAEK